MLFRSKVLLTNILRAIILGEQGWNLPQQLTGNIHDHPLHPKPKEIARDYYCRALTQMMITQLRTLQDTTIYGELL